MKFFICKVCILFATLLCTAQNDYHNYLLTKFERGNGLTNGTFVLGANEQDKMNRITNYGEGSRDAPLNTAPAEVPFNTYFEYNIPNRLLSPSNVGTLLNGTNPVNSGDTLLLIFWMKGISDVIGGNGVARISVNDGSNDLFIEYKFFNDEWTEYIIPIQAKRYSENMRFSISWGHQAQQVQFGGLALINYGSTNTQLPSLNHIEYYNGIDSNASWRAAAQNRIEQYRKANLTVKVVDQNDNPLPNANVSVDMDEHEFGFGSAVQAQLIAASHPKFDQEYVDTLLNLDGKGHGFNEIVFENAFKWPKWEKNEPFDLTKKQKFEAIRFLKEKGIRIRGHSLLWPGTDHMPKDVEDDPSNTNFVKERIRQHINTILNYDDIKNNMIDWDVINEITTNRLLADSLGSREIYQDVMRWAKESLPNTKLYLNDFMTISYGGLDIHGPAENIGDYDQYDTCMEYLQEIDDSGVPFDGIGFQCHIRSLPIGPPTVYGILEDFNQKFGKDMKITEFDMIAVPDSIQDEYMSDFLTIAFSHPKVKSFLMWGFTDEHHWLRDEDPSSSPMFDVNRSLKESGEAFVNLVFKDWWTNEQTNSNGDGLASFRPFKGKHTITASYNGVDACYKVDLNEDLDITLKIEEQPLLGDVNRDGEISSVDALLIVQYAVGLRTESSCYPLQNNELYLPNADVDNDGDVDAIDALFILQCIVGIENVFCQDAGNRENQTTEPLIKTDKRLKVYPNLVKDFVTIQYESEENSNQVKMAFITNINNQIVREIEIPNQASWSTVLDVADLTAGLYTITLIDGVDYETLKLIKN